MHGGFAGSESRVNVTLCHHIASIIDVYAIHAEISWWSARTREFIRLPRGVVTTEGAQELVEAQLPFPQHNLVLSD